MNGIIREINDNVVISIDFYAIYNNEFRYIVNIFKQSDNYYKRDFIYKDKKYPDSVKCRKYDYNNNFALIGEWIENDKDFIWDCELQQGIKELIS